MHDIDRTQLEFAPEVSEFEAPGPGFGNAEWETDSESLSENEEYELATELLGVTSELELDQFIAGLLKKATGTLGNFVRSPIAKAVGGVLKSVAKKALPLAGGALGATFGGPLGAKIGSGLASAAGSALGLESEATAEDREFEGARQFVRLAADTATRAAAAPHTANPAAIASASVNAAARRHAPGLLPRVSQGPAVAASAGSVQSGRWVRRGGRIVLYGA